MSLSENDRVGKYLPGTRPGTRPGTIPFVFFSVDTHFVRILNITFQTRNTGTFTTSIRNQTLRKEVLVLILFWYPSRSTKVALDNIRR